MIGGLLKSTSSLAILAAAGLLVGGVTLAPKAARAADLGGDCCADLEERVANLEATTVKKGNRKVSLTLSGRVAYTVMYFSDNSSPAANAANGAAPVTTDSKTDFLAGTSHSGNGPALFFDGTGKVSSDTVIGYHMEIDFDLSGSTSQNTRQGGTAIGYGDNFIYVSSKSLGRVNLGSLDGVVDDFGGEGFATGYVVGMQGSLRGVSGFWLRDSAGGNSAIKYSSFFSGLDTARDTGIKYISPTFANWLTFEAAYTGDHSYSVGALLSGNVSKTLAVKLGAAYATSSEGDALTLGKQAAANQNGKANTWTVSGGLNETTSGLFLQGDYAIAYADGNAAATGVTAAVAPTLSAVAAPCVAGATGACLTTTPPTLVTAGALASPLSLTHLQDMNTWEVLGGWHKNVNGAGITEIWGSYQHSNNQYADNTSGTAYQIGIDQAIDSASAHIFLTYENYNASISGVVDSAAGAAVTTVDSQNLSTIVGGMSITF